MYSVKLAKARSVRHDRPELKQDHIFRASIRLSNASSAASKPTLMQGVFGLQRLSGLRHQI